MAGFITSITWIASYLSFAANACGAAVNSGALCAGDWTALMANFGEMATAACSAISIPIENPTNVSFQLLYSLINQVKGAIMLHPSRLVQQ